MRQSLKIDYIKKKIFTYSMHIPDIIVHII